MDGYYSYSFIGREHSRSLSLSLSPLLLTSPFLQSTPDLQQGESAGEGRRGDMMECSAEEISPPSTLPSPVRV